MTSFLAIVPFSFPLHLTSLARLLFIACKMVQASSIQYLLALFSCALAANAASVPLSHRQAANLTVATVLPTNWTYVGCYRCVREYVADDLVI